MSGKTQTTKYPAIDAAKFIMAIFVVAIHTDPLIHYGNRVIQTIYSCLLHSAVPFFFLATGFLLVKNADAAATDLRSAIRRYLTRTVKLYTLWHILYLPLVIHHFCVNDYTVVKAVLVTLRSYFLVGKNFNADILWYLLSSIYALVFVSLLLKFRLSLTHILLCGGVIYYIFGMQFSYVTYYTEATPTILRTFRQALELAFTTGRVFTGFFYIPLGMLLARKHPPLALGLILMIGGFAGNYLLSGDSGTAMLAVQATGTLITVSRLALPDAPVYPFLRKTSTNIYFLHQWVMFVYCAVTGQLHRQGPDVFAATLLVSLLLSCILLHFQNRSKKRM